MPQEPSADCKHVSAPNAETMLRALSCLSIAGNFICYEGEMSGLTALCKMLETNSSLLSLKYAPAPHISVAAVLASNVDVGSLPRASVSLTTESAPKAI